MRFCSVSEFYLKSTPGIRTGLFVYFFLARRLKVSRKNFQFHLCELLGKPFAASPQKKTTIRYENAGNPTLATCRSTQRALSGQNGPPETGTPPKSVDHAGEFAISEQLLRKFQFSNMFIFFFVYCLTLSKSSGKRRTFLWASCLSGTMVNTERAISDE